MGFDHDAVSVTLGDANPSDTVIINNRVLLKMEEGTALPPCKEQVTMPPGPECSQLAQCTITKATAAATTSASTTTPSTTTTSTKGCCDETYQISVLCFNVFTGSPLPFYGNTSPSLEDSERLRLQLDHIRQIAPDVLCLQEVCSNGVER